MPVTQEPGGRSPWLMPSRWIELLMLTWAIGVGVHYYRAMGFIDLVFSMLGWAE